MGRPRKADSAAVRDPVAVEIGKRLTEARKAKRWRLEDLATHSGLSVSRLGNYETGERMPGPGEIRIMAKALGESAPYLYALVDDKQPASVRNSEEAALLELYRTVDPADRKKTIDRLGAMALLKKEGIKDAELEHLSAKGKATTPTGDAARARSRSRRRETERGS